MQLLPITPVAALVPVLVKAIVREVGPQICRRRVIGKIRRDLDSMGELPGIMGPAKVLSSCCRDCKGCTMKDR